MASSCIKNQLRWLFIKLIRIYQYCVSPFLLDCCRFTPSCSIYTQQSIDKFGILKGLYLGFLRILRCQPFCAGGCDPVPEHFSERDYARFDS